MRFRRSVKILPGVRINFNKNSTGLTLGPRGAHYTINSSGRRTTSYGIPGTGIWWQDSYNPNSKRRRAAREVEEAEPLYEKDVELKPKPNLLSKKYEREIYDALLEMDKEKFSQIAQNYPEAEIFAKFMMVTIMVRNPETGREGLKIGEEVWARREELLNNPMYRKYAPGVKSQMQIVPGIYYKGPYTAHLLGYVLSELYQVDNQFDKSEAILKEISPDFLTPMALLEIDFLQKRYQKVIDATDNPSLGSNEDVAKQMYRAMAFRESGQPDEAILLLSEIIKLRSVDKSLNYRSRYERGLAYAKAGQSKKALADFHFVLAKEGEYLDITDQIKKLE